MFFSCSLQVACPLPEPLNYWFELIAPQNPSIGGMLQAREDSGHGYLLSGVIPAFDNITASQKLTLKLSFDYGPEGIHSMPIGWFLLVWLSDIHEL